MQTKTLSTIASALLVACIGALTLAGCDSNSSDPVENPTQNPEKNSEKTVVPLNLTAEEAAAARSTQAFGFDFLRAVNATEAENNVVVAPLSAEILLAMAANATDGTGRAEIASALGTSDLETLNRLCNKYITIFPQLNEEATMTLANAMWYDRTLTLTESYRHSIAGSFNAELVDADFGNHASVISDINRWCAQQTGNRIREIIGELNPEARAVIANAMFFKGNWTTPFDKELTAPAIFKGSATESEVDMMNLAMAMPYRAGADFQAITLTFGKSESNFEMTFILPAEGASINSFVQSFTFEELNATRADFRMVNLKVPAFEHTSETMKLNDALAALGVKRMFDNDGLKFFETGELNGQTEIVQRTTLKINEYGAEASAVTSLGSALESDGDNNTEVVNVVLDRPFLFCITESQTGACLVAGKIVNM